MEFRHNFLTFEAYLGDTLENFQACHVKGQGGQLFLDRSKETEYMFRETYVFRGGVVDPFDYALTVAKRLGHTPMVVSGKLPILSKYVLSSLVSGSCIVLPQGMGFPVEKLWLTKKEFDWREFNQGINPDWWIIKDTEVRARLELWDPNDLVSEITHANLRTHHIRNFRAHQTRESIRKAFWTLDDLWYNVGSSRDRELFQQAVYRAWKAIKAGNFTDIGEKPDMVCDQCVNPCCKDSYVSRQVKEDEIGLRLKIGESVSRLCTGLTDSQEVIHNLQCQTIDKVALEFGKPLADVLPNS